MNLLPSCSILLTVIAATVVSGNPSCEIPKEFLKAVRSKKEYANQSSGGSHSEESHSEGSKSGGSKSGGSKSGDEDNDKNNRSKRDSLSDSCECGRIARILITDTDGQVVEDLKRCSVCPNGQAPQEDPTYCDGVESIPCQAQRSMPACVGKVAFYSCCNEDEAEADTAEKVAAIVVQPATTESTTPSTTTLPPPP